MIICTKLSETNYDVSDLLEDTCGNRFVLLALHYSHFNSHNVIPEVSTETLVGLKLTAIDNPPVVGERLRKIERDFEGKIAKPIDCKATL